MSDLGLAVFVKRRLAMSVAGNDVLPSVKLLFAQNDTRHHKAALQLAQAVVDVQLNAINRDEVLRELHLKITSAIHHSEHPSAAAIAAHLTFVNTMPDVQPLTEKQMQSIAGTSVTEWVKEYTVIRNLLKDPPEDFTLDVLALPTPAQEAVYTISAEDKYEEYRDAIPMNKKAPRGNYFTRYIIAYENDTMDIYCNYFKCKRQELAEDNPILVAQGWNKRGHKLSKGTRVQVRDFRQQALL